MKLLLATLFTALFFISLHAQPPVGYYDSTNNKYCDSLKTALKKILSSSVIPQSYKNLWSQYPLTDIKPRTKDSGSANVIWDIYSSISGGTDPYQFTPATNQCGSSGYKAEGDCYNREHSVPLSWFSGSTATNGTATDYNFIFPTDGVVNAKRANYPYGEVVSATFTSRNGSKLGQSAVAGIPGTVFEPRDEFKGDVARAFLYFVTMYQDNIPAWAANPDAAKSFDTTTFPSVKLPFLQLMIKWHNQDPVSQKEIDRNNGTYSFQHNRNPFIDSPQLVSRIWNASCPKLSTLPVNLIFFTGKQNGSKVLLKWQVANEVNLANYEVQRSVDGAIFTSITTLKAAGVSNYSYTDIIDANSGSVVYYRLKKMDKNAISGYSEVLRIAIPVAEHITVYPNPAKNYINIVLNKYTTSPMDVAITDAMGRITFHSIYTSSNNAVHIPIYNFANGNYYARIMVGNDSYVQKIIIAK